MDTTMNRPCLACGRYSVVRGYCRTCGARVKPTVIKIPSRDNCPQCNAPPGECTHKDVDTDAGESEGDRGRLG